MGLFRRRRKAEPVEEQHDGGAELEPAAAAHRFWSRWAELLPQINAALGDRQPQRFEHALASAVLELHQDLHFSVDSGERAIYSLVISGQEDPALRPYTDAWKAAAPPDDLIWEYHDAVPPVPDTDKVTVNLGEHRIALADVRVAAQVDEQAGVVDVAVHHPKMAELGEAAAAAMTFLPLDATLGERLAGERLRRVETAHGEPQDAITLPELRDLVWRLAGIESPADPHE